MGLFQYLQVLRDKVRWKDTKRSTICNSYSTRKLEHVGMEGIYLPFDILMPINVDACWLALRRNLSVNIV